MKAIILHLSFCPKKLLIFSSFQICSWHFPEVWRTPWWYCCLPVCLSMPIMTLWQVLPVIFSRVGLGYYSTRKRLANSINAFIGLLVNWCVLFLFTGLEGQWDWVKLGSVVAVFLFILSHAVKCKNGCWIHSREFRSQTTAVNLSKTFLIHQKRCHCNANQKWLCNGLTNLSFIVTVFFFLLNTTQTPFAEQSHRDIFGLLEARAFKVCLTVYSS